jgi:hypothetical protein
VANLSQTLVSFSLISSKKSLSKTFDIVDGKLVKEAAAQLYEGTSRRITIPFAEIPNRLSTTTSRQAVTWGVHTPSPDIIALRTIKKADCKNTFPRSRDFYTFQREPGVLFLDIDSVDYDPAEILEIIGRIHPEFRSAARIIRKSISSGVFIAGQPPSPKKSFHLYVLVANASDIPRYQKTLSQRLKLEGYHFPVNSHGRLLSRTIIDDTVGQPERLDFVGMPVINNRGISYQPPETIFIEGDILETKTLIPISKTLEERLKEIHNQARKKLQPELDKSHAAWVDKQIKKAEENGVSEKAIAIAKVIYAENHQNGACTLPFSHRILFDDPALGEVSILNILGNPLKYEGATCADPIEGIAYGRNKGKVFFHKNGELLIHSFVHGGINYTVKLPELSNPKNLNKDRKLYNDAPDELKDIYATAIIERYWVNYPASPCPLCPTFEDFVESFEFSDEKHKELFAWGVKRQAQRGFCIRWQLLHGVPYPTPLNMVGIDIRNATTPQKILRVIKENPDTTIMVRAPHGFGKTQHIIKPLIKDWQPTCPKDILITNSNRISLTSHNAVLFDAVDSSQWRKFELSDQLTLADNKIATVTPSLGNNKLASVIPLVRAFIADEGGATLQEIFTGAEHIKNHRALFNKIGEIRAASTMDLWVDADLTSLNASMLKEQLPNKNIIFIIVDAKPNGKTVTIGTNKHFKRREFNTRGSDINRIMVCDSKTKLRNIMLGDLRPQLTIHGENNGEPAVRYFNANPSEQCKKYQAIGYTSAIASGVSLEIEHFTNHLGLFTGVVTATAAFQMMRRDRTATNLEMFFTGHATLEQDAEILFSTAQWFNGEYFLDNFDRAMSSAIAFANWQKNNMPIVTWVLAENLGFTPINATLEIVDEELMKETNQQAAIKEYQIRREGISKAPKITQHQYENISRQHVKTQSESNTVTQFQIRSINEDIPLEQAIDEWCKGNIIAWKENAEDFCCRISDTLHCDRIDNAEKEIPALVKQNRSRQFGFLWTILEEINFDCNTGTCPPIDNIIAKRAYDCVDKEDIAKFSGYQPKNPKYTRWLQNILRDKLGLNLVFQGRKFKQSRTYVIATEPTFHKITGEMTIPGWSIVARKTLATVRNAA